MEQIEICFYKTNKGRKEKEDPWNSNKMANQHGAVDRRGVVRGLERGMRHRGTKEARQKLKRA